MWILIYLLILKLHCISQNKHYVIYKTTPFILFWCPGAASSFV